MPRVHTSIDDETLARLDARAGELGISRSRLIREAVIFAEGMSVGQDASAIHAQLAAIHGQLVEFVGRLEVIEEHLGLGHQPPSS